ncbi:hypothetical protein C0995_010982 [Termitomyces sp. Mi166|nr:hypothetical protein C0995_010982 [Termitomyces sp. Mi166\
MFLVGQSTVDDSKEYLIPTQTIKDGVQGFSESIKFVLNVLQDFSKVHPFAEAACTAFNLVITLELKRRDNDDKAIAVLAEMKKTMEAFLPLQDIQDSQGFEPSTNLKKLVDNIKDYIEETGDYFDLYYKKSKIKRYLKSVIYEAKFAEYATQFIQLQDQVQQELSILTVIGVATVSTKLDVGFAELQQQMKAVFARLDSPREKEIRKFIQDNDGPRAVVNKLDTLQKINELSGDSNPSGRSDKDWKKLQRSLLSELSENLDEALKRNMSTFEKKLEMQKQDMIYTLELNKNQIITTLTGSFEQIKDSDIREIWKEMQWKSTVKARHFVLALRDYYLAQSGPRSKGWPAANVLPQERSVQIRSPEYNNDDTWATAYLNVSYLQGISEAIDDDASGFIHFREVNGFTSMCPKGWSVQQWLAYWAAGWQSSIIQYATKIYRLLRKFHKLRDKVRPDNLKIVDYYLNHSSFDRLEMLLRSIDRAGHPIPPELSRLRDEYCNAEEKKLTKNLEVFDFNIDSVAMVSFVTGTSRIERLARRYTLHLDEFDNKNTTLEIIFDAFNAKFEELLANCKHMYIDAAIHFKQYAFGMFKTRCDGRDSGSTATEMTIVSVLRDLPSEPGEYDDIDICPNDVPLEILDVPPEEVFNISLEETSDIPSEGIPDTSPDIFGEDIQNTPNGSGLTIPTCEISDLGRYPNHVYGLWAGFFTSNTGENLAVPQGLMRVLFKNQRDQDGSMSGTINGYLGIMDLKYDVLHQIEDTHYKVDFTITDDVGDQWLRCIGVFDATSAKITGDVIDMYDDINSKIGLFRLSRTPASLIQFRYTEDAPLENPARARWNFACRLEVLERLNTERQIKDDLGKEEVTGRLLALERQLGQIMDLTRLRNGLGEDRLVQETQPERVESEVSSRLTALESRLERLEGLLQKVIDGFHTV